MPGSCWRANWSTTPRYLDDARLAVVAGGFSYADSLGAGRMLALDLTLGLGDRLHAFVGDGTPAARNLQRVPGPEPDKPAARVRSATTHRARSTAAGWSSNGTEEQQHLDEGHRRPDPLSDRPRRRPLRPPRSRSLEAAGQVALRYRSTNPERIGRRHRRRERPERSRARADATPGEPHRRPPASASPTGRRWPAHLGLRIFEAGVAHAKQL